MVAPKNISTSSKEKSGEKKAISSSPEPFQEPDGMTTIDLNKSDDYSCESEVDKAKLKKQAQIKYVAQLLFALGSIFVVVMLFFMMTFLNKEYHLFTVVPLKVNQSYAPPTYIHSSFPTEEFLNLSKILNQEKFKKKLRTGNYIKRFPLEMDLCKVMKSIEFCCEIFRESDLHDFTESCTVNDMLSYLIEYETNPRKKRQLEYGVYGKKLPQKPHDDYIQSSEDKLVYEHYPEPDLPLNKYEIYEYNQLVNSDFPYEDVFSETPHNINRENYERKHEPQEKKNTLPNLDTKDEKNKPITTKSNTKLVDKSANIAADIAKLKNVFFSTKNKRELDSKESFFSNDLFNEKTSSHEENDLHSEEQFQHNDDVPPVSEYYLEPDLYPRKYEIYEYNEITNDLGRYQPWDNNDVYSQEKKYNFKKTKLLMERDNGSKEKHSDSKNINHNNTPIAKTLKESQLKEKLAQAFNDKKLHSNIDLQSKHLLAGNSKNKRQAEYGHYDQNYPYYYNHLEPTYQEPYQDPYNNFNQYQSLPNHQEDYLQAAHVSNQEPTEPKLNLKTGQQNRDGPLITRKKIQFPENMISEIERSSHNFNQYQSNKYEGKYLQAFHEQYKQDNREKQNFETPQQHGYVPIVSENTIFDVNKILPFDHRKEANNQFQNLDPVNNNIFLKDAKQDFQKSDHNEKMQPENLGSQFAPKVHGIFPPLPQHVREDILSDVTLSPKVHIYRSSDFDQPVNEYNLKNQYFEGDIQRQNKFKNFEQKERLGKDDRRPIEPSKEYRFNVDANGKFHMDNNQNMATYNEAIVSDIASDAEKNGIIGLSADLPIDFSTSYIQNPPPLQVKGKKHDPSREPLVLNVTEFKVEDSRARNSQPFQNKNITKVEKSIVSDIANDAKKNGLLESSADLPIDSPIYHVQNPNRKPLVLNVTNLNIEKSRAQNSQPFQMKNITEVNNSNVSDKANDAKNPEILGPSSHIHNPRPLQVKAKKHDPSWKPLVLNVTDLQMEQSRVQNSQSFQEKNITKPNNSNVSDKAFDVENHGLIEQSSHIQHSQPLQIKGKKHDASREALNLNVTDSIIKQSKAQNSQLFQEKNITQFNNSNVSDKVDNVENPGPIGQSSHIQNLSPLQVKGKKPEPSREPSVLNVTNSIIDQDRVQNSQLFQEKNITKLNYSNISDKAGDVENHRTIGQSSHIQYPPPSQINGKKHDASKEPLDLNVTDSKMEQSKAQNSPTFQKNITQFYNSNVSDKADDGQSKILGQSSHVQNSLPLQVKEKKPDPSREPLVLNVTDSKMEQSRARNNQYVQEENTTIAGKESVKEIKSMSGDAGVLELIEKSNKNKETAQIEKENKEDLPSNFVRASNAQDDFRSKHKQDSFTASEDTQSNQQTFVNPCFNPYVTPYIPYMPPAKLGSAQESGFLKVVSVSQPHVQNQPMYVINPSMLYGIPQTAQPTYPSLTQTPFHPQGLFPQSSYGGNYNSPVQVTSSSGQYYMCNPIPTPSNNIAGLAGVEVRRESGNLQNLMEDLKDYANNNKSRDATLVCPLGEQACLDNTKCIKKHHICDNEVHCDDSSDEVGCTCKERVGKLRLCDGYCDCPSCDDEAGCFGCEEDELSCDDWSRFRRSTCIPISQKCDGIKQCEITGKDEMDCSILVDHIGNFPLNKVSNSVGFLHRNYKGKWYPTCFGTELWAAEVCQVEAGPSAIIPKAHMTLTTDPYNGLFINILPNNEVSLVNSCVQDRAAFVECPPIYCGLRFLVNNPYRNQEVETSIEDMLNDLERAYKMREDTLARTLDSEIALDRTNLNKSENSFELKDDFDALSKKHRSARFADLGNKDQLTQAHLEEVIENLERTFRRRDILESDLGSDTLKQSRVVGGRPSQPAAWPWLVSIYKNGIFHCGGVLINELWVATASHCVDRYWQYYYEVQAGALRRFSYSPMDQHRWVKIVVPHELYSKSNLRNDIALMKLSAPVRYNKYVRPICLPSEITAGRDFLKGPAPGTICTTVGWGATVEHGADPDHMREVEVPILKHCKHKEDSDIDEICAGLSEGGKDACQGDSGGPLICRNPNNPNQWYLAGIVSHGEGCARPNEPGVYTKVSRYMGWIAENIREDKLTIIMPLHKCPGYECKGTKRCTPKKRRCDRIVDCLLGDDEIDCENHYSQFFKHSRKSMISTPPIKPDDILPDLTQSLLPFSEFGIVGSTANGTTEKPDGDEESLNASINGTNKDIITKSSKSLEKDGESKQKPESEDVYFRCTTMLQVIPKNKRCNKIIDCEDGTDESNCTCADYIKNVDSSSICDGISDCLDLSDEKDCVLCNKTQYTCRIAQKCINISRRCDGVPDCPQHEDENDCGSLTNGQTLGLDQDDRPLFKSRGIVTNNYLGEWKPLCINQTLVNEEPRVAALICALLGFDDYVSYHKYLVENKNMNKSYSFKSGKISLMQETKKCDNCCEGLYVSCSNISTSTTLHYKSLEQAKEVYFSPWTAVIYSNGHYKCMGTLLNEYWVVTSVKCFIGITTLQGKYVAAIFGKGKLNLPVRGPHEQVIRIVESIVVDETDILLLRLDKKVKYNRYVQAANLNGRREGFHKEKCYAVGQDNENRVKFVPLFPLKNCLVGFKCFEKKIEEPCKDIHSWSGTILCDSRNGWYPAAVFNEESGHCGFHHEKKYTSVKFYRNNINNAMAQIIDPTPPPHCDGLLCDLGNCISKEKLCDGVLDCHSGEDENASLCYAKEKECNVADECVCPQTHLKCPTNHKCFPKSSFCDRINNCGEFEDEPDICSCRNYLKLTDPGKICDGVLNCMDRSDEDPNICGCKFEDFQCGKTDKCVPQDMVCDGFKDCPNGEDETKCLSLNTESHARTNAGEVMTRTAGVWHSGCFDLNYSTLQLEEICYKLGFAGGSANQLTPPHNLTTVTTLRPVLDNFDVVWLRRIPGNKLKLRMRTGHNPYVKFVPDKRCHRLFIACI